MATTNNVLPICNSQFLFNAEIGEHDDGLSIFLSVRCNLFRIAYRMLKNAAEAEDIVQDVWLRWQTTDRRVVLDPPAYLATATTRMCINLYRSARCRRERYVDSWLTEPVDTVSNPWQGTECKEALMSAVCELLEKLRPTERAAYVLRKAFDYSYRQIANILQMEETNVRQLVSRARRSLADGRRARASSARQKRLLGAFIDAAQTGDLATLENLLIQDVFSGPESSRPLRAAPFSVLSHESIAKYIAAVASHISVHHGKTVERMPWDGAVPILTATDVLAPAGGDR